MFSCIEMIALWCILSIIIDTCLLNGLLKKIDKMQTSAVAKKGPLMSSTCVVLVNVNEKHPPQRQTATALHINEEERSKWRVIIKNYRKLGTPANVSLKRTFHHVHGETQQGKYCKIYSEARMTEGQAMEQIMKDYGLKIIKFKLLSIILMTIILIIWHNQ